MKTDCLAITSTGDFDTVIRGGGDVMFPSPGGKK
jgi:hypothetical protein